MWEDRKDRKGEVKGIRSMMVILRSYRPFGIYYSSKYQTRRGEAPKNLSLCLGLDSVAMRMEPLKCLKQMGE